MLTDHDLQQMYELAHWLHPDHGIALSVTLEACERLVLLQRTEDRCTGHYRLRLPEACLPQYCVFLASDAHERDQEPLRAVQEPRYELTPDDYLVRYLKCLVWWTMDRNACHVAVALGCFLYGYQPGDIANLAPELFNLYDTWRVKRRLEHQLYTRFRHTHIFLDEQHTLHTRPTTEHERRLVHHSLVMFTPWGSPYVPPPAPGISILDTYFAGAAARSDWERIHALIDPTCAGLPHLIREYNAHLPEGSDIRLEDPDHRLAIPCFHP